MLLNANNNGPDCMVLASCLTPLFDLKAHHPYSGRPTPALTGISGHQHGPRGGAKEV